ncbi:uncharacterized protein [Haliotis cracherodii]|uniref:uncharacterized protein n=1 Tax=Haliotis cracherodii TaxID=6455 RepID=UPI0039EC8AAA
MGIPEHLQHPLSIDTSINYDLDLSKFPGLGDPRYHNEPMLIIAPCSRGFFDEFQRSNSQVYGSTTRKCQNEIHLPTRLPAVAHPGGLKDIRDDLRDIMDIPNTDLIVDLGNTAAYHSIIEDVIHGLPYFDDLRYVEGPSANQKPKCYVPSSTRQYPEICTTEIGQTTLPDVSKGCAVSSNVNYRNVSYMNTPVYSKRKRVHDDSDIDLNKRQCFRSGHKDYLYSNHYAGQSFGTYSAIGFRNQVRVI